MYIESITLQNFQCFGPNKTEIGIDAGFTALIGGNGSGKTAACQALVRLFGVSTGDRTVRVDDFHVPAGETSPPGNRSLTIEAVLAFPELDENNDLGRVTVPEFFHRMASTADGSFKCRITLKATWEADGTLDGSVTETREVVLTLDEDYDPVLAHPLPPAERSRIQVIYVPASRDGARQLAAFLRSRIWRAARWSPDIRDLIAQNAAMIAGRFHGEPSASVVEATLARRWKELHDADTHAIPRLRPLEGDLAQLLRDTELVFEPTHTGKPRSADLLSDGQRSLLHLALTAAALDIEGGLADGSHAEVFDLGNVQLPTLTVVIVEEPENSLSPFYLSRIAGQLKELSAGPRVQAIIASHSAGALARIEPEKIRYFRLDAASGTALVRPITLPEEDTEAGKYVREAVRAHPELYFARFVLLGEGDSEQIVIPRVAEARGIALDPSFVAMVPLGGRHTNHFWKLLNDLGIPHATLLDLDYGRADGGGGRLRDACAQLLAQDVDVFAGLGGYEKLADVTADISFDQAERIAAHLRSFGVFFSSPLDLDHCMVRAFPDAYLVLTDSERGPHSSDARESVLGAGHPPTAYWYPGDQEQKAERDEELRWYRYLFLSRSKPGTHLSALTRLTDDELKNGPEVLNELVGFIQRRLSL
ncbi:AAA family ATPase [Nonomuraea sp. LP-02]|uniref:ATP-dependent nuclease n=1 Tax=Nonomuraea sp. LP-02 TaxID=3097960 RepID=UPI002E2EB991|nr:AAA family ATPase [Nonomuraea sp. LP-02]MED7928813.1 AAA family ATPase [Nonomuraea sp. LP-02]